MWPAVDQGRVWCYQPAAAVKPEAVDQLRRQKIQTEVEWRRKGGLTEGKTQAVHESRQEDGVRKVPLSQEDWLAG